MFSTWHYQSLTSLWRNFGRLFSATSFSLVEVCGHSFMHSSLKVPPQHFNQVEVGHVREFKVILTEFLWRTLTSLVPLRFVWVPLDPTGKDIYPQSCRWYQEISYCTNAHSSEMCEISQASNELQCCVSVWQQSNFDEKTVGENSSVGNTVSIQVAFIIISLRLVFNFIECRLIWSREQLIRSERLSLAQLKC